MARLRRNQSLNDVIENAVAGTVARIRRLLDSAVERMAAAEAERRLAARSKRGGRARGLRPQRGRRRSEMTRWVTDKRARRVPTFVIEATGLDTKKKIVAKFGEYAVFEKGRPLPKPNPSPTKPAETRPVGQNPDRVVRARPPIVRRGAALRRAM